MSCFQEKIKILTRMKPEPVNIPLSVKIPLILLALTIFIVFLYAGQHIIFPIILAMLIAILLRPVVDLFFIRMRFPYVIASALSVFLFILCITAILLFVYWQIGHIINDWNKIKENISIHYHHLQEWIKEQFNISYSEQEKYIRQATRESLSNTTSKVGNTLSSFSDALINLIVIPVYTFLMLLYKDMFKAFLFKVYAEKHHLVIRDILKNVKMAIQSFLTGLLTEMIIVSTLTSIGYMTIGIQYALLLGVITGILNLIPYIGITIAALLSIVATLTSSTEYSVVLGVIIVNIIVQAFDNNILVPMVVSSKVSVNALASIVGIIAGGALGGVVGMFVAIPLLAIMKVVFDRIEMLRPWGYLLGDELPVRKRKKLIISRKN